MLTSQVSEMFKAQQFFLWSLSGMWLFPKALYSYENLINTLLHIVTGVNMGVKVSYFYQSLECGIS